MQLRLWVSALLVVSSLVGCAEGQDTTLGLRDSGKPGSDGGTLPGDDATPGDDSTPGDDTGSTTDGGGCSVPTGKVCTTVPQCGCGATQNCDVTKTDGTTACVAAGTVGLNGSCSDIGECDHGFTCVGGICKPPCRDAGDCASGSTCEQVQYTPSGSTTPADIPGFKVCSVTDCDPLAPSGACGPANCWLLSDGTATCVGAGSGTTAGSCSEADPFTCAPGYMCVDTSGSGSTDCLQWCRIGFPGDCISGTCTGFSTPAMKGGTEYGVCF